MNAASRNAFRALLAGACAISLAPHAARADTTLTLTGVTCTSNGGTSFTCTADTPPPSQGGTPACTLSANPNPVTIPQDGSAQQVTVSANCSNGPITGYAWTRNGNSVTGATNQTFVDSIAAQTTYQVQATNANGTGNPSATLTVSTVAGGGGTPPPAGFCANYPGSMQATMNPWGIGGTTKTMTQGAAVSYAFTVPAGTAIGSSGSYGWAPTGTTNYGAVTATISSTPCDFRDMPGDWRTGLDYSGSNGPINSQAGANGTIPFTIGSTSSRTQPTLVPGKTYYLNFTQAGYNGRWTLLVLPNLP